MHKFNKQNPGARLNSQQLGISGNCSPVFVSEHLSPSNKSLHAAVRKRAKELGIKFVWVRDARIYTRKDENSQDLEIRSLDSISFRNDK